MATDEPKPEPLESELSETAAAEGVESFEAHKKAQRQLRLHLARKHFDAIELLLSGCTMADVAREIGVHRSTVYDWVTHPTFKAELDRMAGLYRKEVERSLISTARRAAKNLDYGIDNELPMSQARLVQFSIDRVLKATSPDVGGE